MRDERGTIAAASADERPATETIIRLAGTADEPTLLVRHVPGSGPSVIYVHGATFSSALSIGYRFEGRSWADDLHARGFDVWAFDFAGYGGSDRSPAFDLPASAAPPVGRAPDAAGQIARVVAHVLRTTGRTRVSLVAHSWGTIAAGLFATRHPGHVDRLVLFGPIARREMPDRPPADSLGAWRLVTVPEQHARFIADVPPGRPPVLIEPDLADWGPAYLASDPDAGSRRPDPAIKIPSGPQADILDAWSGEFGYDPGAVTAPTLVIRGEWDSVCNDTDANWLLEHLGANRKRDVKVPEGTHLMHLEHARGRLFEETAAFLSE